MNSTDIKKLAKMLEHYARILDGEIEDLTGIGFHTIMLRHVEEALDVKIISTEQYAAFTRLVEEDIKRWGG